VNPPRPNLFARVRSGTARRWAAAKGRHRWVRHVLDAWQLMTANNGAQYAAAITYFSFLALFPLALLAIAVTGFILHAHPAAQQSLLHNITSHVPGELGRTLRSSVDTAIRQRTGVGVVGLVGVVLTGLGWIGNLRAAIDAVWGGRPAPGNFFAVRFKNLLLLLGLGLGTLVSLGLTVAGTALTDQIARGLDLTQVAGLHYLLRVLGLLLAVAGDVVIFWWLLVRLPAAHVAHRAGLHGAVLAAVGFEALKVVGTYTIAMASHSPTAGPFAGLVAVLIWMQLVARNLLFWAAWIATCPVQPPATVVSAAQPD